MMKRRLDTFEGFSMTTPVCLLTSASMLVNLRLATLLTAFLIMIIISSTLFALTLFYGAMPEQHTPRIINNQEVLYPTRFYDGKQNVPWVNENTQKLNQNLTFAGTSSWRVLTSTIAVGRPFHVLLTSRDQHGNVKSEGGDYYHAVLYGNAGNDSYPIPWRSLGKITDLLNGSYLITFVPAWSGPAFIRVQLWLTSDAVALVKRAVKSNYVFLCAFEDDYGIKVDYSGPQTRTDVLWVLEDGIDRGDAETLLCRMAWYPLKYQRDSKTSSCDISFPRRFRQRWYGTCFGPRSFDLSGKCGSLKWCVYDNSMASEGVRQRKIASLGTGYVFGNIDSVMVSEGDEKVKDSSVSKSCSLQPVVRAQGHWFGEEWIDSHCSSPCNSEEKWWRCLTGTDVYFVGDSTIRQLHYLILSSAGVQVLQNSNYVPEILKNVYVRKYNATIRYRIHGPPLMTSLVVNYNLATFSADVIDSIPGNGNEILVLSCVHHFILMSPKGFQHRLQEIVNAIGRLRKRRMGRAIPIVVRTANCRKLDSLRVNSYRVKWYNEMMVRKFVNADLGVMVYDIFDMAAAGSNPGGVHQPLHVMSAQTSHILSLICNERCT